VRQEACGARSFVVLHDMVRAARSIWCPFFVISYFLVCFKKLRVLGWLIPCMSKDNSLD
jgi:hypothetical protein